MCYNPTVNKILKNEDSYRLNAVVLGLEKVLTRYKHYLLKFTSDTQKLINTQIGQEIMKAIKNDAPNNSDNQFSKILKYLNVKNDLMLNYNLDNFCKLIKENSEIVNFFNEDETIKSMSDYAEERGWISQCLIVNVDTYINMFFKLMYNIENDKDLPRGFNDNPKSRFYQDFPILNAKLDYEFTVYNELHAIRNNIIHNGMIVDKKLLNKLSIDNGSFNSGITVYLPSFEKIVLYALSCLEIVMIVNDEIIKNTRLAKDIETREIFQYLAKYRNYKKT